jgi:hypothetical protein
MCEPQKRKSLVGRHADADLQAALNADFTAKRNEWKLAVPSGALVIALTYHATPEEGSDTSELEGDGEEDERWSEELPMLPRSAPSSIINDLEDPNHRGLAVVPVKPGTYTLVRGSVPGFLRIVIRRSGD